MVTLQKEYSSQKIFQHFLHPNVELLKEDKNFDKVCQSKAKQALDFRAFTKSCTRLEKLFFQKNYEIKKVDSLNATLREQKVVTNKL